VVDAAAAERPRWGANVLTRSRRYIPLLQRVAAINALLVLAAVVVTIILFAPGKVSRFAVDEEIAVVLVALALVVATNVYLLRRVIGPVQALTAVARRVDLTTLSQRLPDAEPTSEAGELAMTFNDMLARLDAERLEASRRILRAQEAERLRIARELHDQTGQELTAVLLGLSRIAGRAPAALEPQVRNVQEAVRSSLEDVRRIAIELRPEALEDLGLVSALAVLADRFTERFDVDLDSQIPAELPPLSPETELVVYRVAQEALTNVGRHSGSERAELALEQDGDRLSLRVRDGGRGLPPDHVAGTGLRGMHERAALVGAQLSIANRGTAPGCDVELDVPVVP
jgi:two-component system, NarL family, sensor histidine kinase UhpB